MCITPKVFISHASKDKERFVEEYQFVSTVEGQADHKWSAELDGRDIYYVTFMDTKGGGHLNVANPPGAILNYNEIRLVESYKIRPSFIEQEGNT